MQERTTDLNGPVHYLDFGGAGPPIVLVHGLGGSSLNWLSVGPQLTAYGRVVALDLAGFGRTLSTGRSARVANNRRLLSRFLEAVAKEPAVLMGNSMGGYLALAQASEEPGSVRSLVLVAPAVPRPPGKKLDPDILAFFVGLMTPFLASVLMRRRTARGPERLVRDLLELCCVDASRVDPEVLEAHIALARERAARGSVPARDFIGAARSLVHVLLRRGAYLEMVRRIRAPGLIVAGLHDRLVRLGAARALADARPDWQFEIMEDVGHVPQLESPERFLAIAGPWLRAHSGSGSA
jgi:pimeloyl-ACP methyl ester carboxylesterase